MLYLSLKKNPVIGEPKKFEEQVRFFEKRIFIFNVFKNCDTRLGWDEVKQIVLCSQEWRDEQLAVSCIICLAISPLFFVIHYALLTFLFI
jgi:hypothetical protein